MDALEPSHGQNYNLNTEAQVPNAYDAWDGQRGETPSDFGPAAVSYSSHATTHGSGVPGVGKIYGHAQRPARENKSRRTESKFGLHNPRSKEDRPWRYFEKIQIDDSQFPPHVRPAAVIIGVKGSNHARMQEVSACCVQLRGRGISSPGTPGADEPMHLWVKYDEEPQLNKVKEVLDEIIRSCDYGPPHLARRTPALAPGVPPSQSPIYIPPDANLYPPDATGVQHQLPPLGGMASGKDSMSFTGFAPDGVDEDGGPFSSDNVDHTNAFCRPGAMMTGSAEDRGFDAVSGSMPLSGGPVSGGLMAPLTAIEFLYSLHIACHQASQAVAPGEFGIWVDKLPRTYQEFFGFPFEIDRFFPPDDLRHTALFKYLINLLSSLSYIVTIQPAPLTVPGPLASGAATTPEDRFFIKAAMPPDVPWPEFEKNANDQLQLLSVGNVPFGSDNPSRGGKPNDTQNISFDDTGGHSVHQIVRPAENSILPQGQSLENIDNLDLDSILSVIDSPMQLPAEDDGHSGHLESTANTYRSGYPPSNHFGQRPLSQLDQMIDLPNRSQIDTPADCQMRESTEPIRLSQEVEQKSNGRHDVPDTPLLLILQAIHRLLVVKGGLKIKVARLAEEFESSMGVALDVTMLGDKDVHEFVAGFPDVFTTAPLTAKEEEAGSGTGDNKDQLYLLPVQRPDFRAVAERLARVMIDTSLAKALKKNSVCAGESRRGAAPKTSKNAVKDGSGFGRNSYSDEKKYRSSSMPSDGDSQTDRKGVFQRRSRTYKQVQNNERRSVFDMQRTVDGLIDEVEELIESYKQFAIACTNMIRR